MEAETAFKMGLDGQMEGFCELMRAEQSVNLPGGAKTGRYRLGATIMVSRDSIGGSCRNADLPAWFAARVCMPPEESGNWYRWYDPFIWYETDFDLSNGGNWCTAKRNMCCVGKLAVLPSYRHDSHKPRGCWCQEFWAIPLEEWKDTEAAERGNEPSKDGEH